MKKSGWWSGPGEGAGTFTDTTLALRNFCKTATQVTMIDLHEIRLMNLGYGLIGTGKTGMILRYCDKEYDTPFEGVVFAGGAHIANGLGEPAPRVERKQIRTVIGTEVDALDVTVYLDSDNDGPLPAADGGGGTPRWTVRDAIRVGFFDGAIYSLRRFFLANPPQYPLTAAQFPTTLGAVVLFRGFIADATISRNKATFGIKSFLEKLNIGVPRNVFQVSCLNSLGDIMCTVDLNSSPVGVPLTVNSHIAAVGSATTVSLTAGDFTAGNYPDTYFQDGIFQFTSGLMAGVRRGITSWTNDGTTNQVTFVNPVPTQPTIGDSATIIAGCNKSVDHCQNKFANFLNPGDHTEGLRYRGFRQTPAPDSAG